MKFFGNQKGFSLVEIIFTVSLFMIVMAIAAYTFKDVIWSSQAKTAVSDFVATAAFARSEAVARGQAVTVCRSTNLASDDAPGTPVPSCSNDDTLDWETGYIVFVDTNDNGVRNANEALLRVVSGPKAGVTMKGNAPVQNSIRYLATGFFPAGVANGTVDVESAGKKYQVLFSSNGRVRSQEKKNE